MNKVKPIIIRTFSGWHCLSRKSGACPAKGGPSEKSILRLSLTALTSACFGYAQQPTLSDRAWVLRSETRWSYCTATFISLNSILVKHPATNQIF